MQKNKSSLNNKWLIFLRYLDKKPIFIFEDIKILEAIIGIVKAKKYITTYNKFPNEKN